jgi:predicted ABC-type ATPase
MDDLYKEITKGVRRSKNKVALFLCGAAGSGKTSSKEQFLKDVGMKTTFVTLNIDDIRPRIQSNESIRDVFNSLIDQTIEDGYSFLYDGTCRDKTNINQRIQSVHDKGYKIVMGITYASLGTVLGRVRRRVDQPLEDDVARDIYAHLRKNVEQYMSIKTIDEVYLYNNEHSIKLIFKRKGETVTCVSPNSNFYFDVSKYC